MSNYTHKTNSFNSSMVINRDFTFAPSDFRYIESNNTVRIRNFIDDENVGEQIDTKFYITQTKTPFKLITIQNMSSLILDKNSGGEFILKNIYSKSTKKIKKDYLLFSRNASLGKVSYVTEDSYMILNGGISMIYIEDELNRYYVMAFFISNYGKEQLELKTSSGGTQQNAKRDDLLDIEIPIPKNEKIRNLVSLIVQNIIDKEKQIKKKNEIINSIIEKELVMHSPISIKMPKSNEILENNFRFDGGIYSKEYKIIKGSIELYKGGYFNLLDRYNANRGQNLQVSNIGISIYSNEKKNNFYRLITNVELTDDRTISTFRYLGNKNQLTLIPKNSIFLSADGSVGRCIYIQDLGKTITNIHPWILISKDEETPVFENIFTAMFLGYLKTVGYYEKIKDKSNGGGIKLSHLENWIKIPDFPKELKKEIAFNYYNDVEKNKELSIENYLEKEKKRNNIIGIWQLNIELLNLKEQLEQLVNDIVYDREIQISNYIKTID